MLKLHRCRSKTPLVTILSDHLTGGETNRNGDDPMTHFVRGEMLCSSHPCSPCYRVTSFVLPDETRWLCDDAI